MNEENFTDQEDLDLVDIGNGIWLPRSATEKPQEDPEYYERFSHPKINFVLMWSVIIIIIAFLIGIILIFHHFASFSVGESIGLGFAVLFGGLLISSRFIAVFAVKLYQHLAPMHIREKCSLTPTCSDYMIQVLLKYGFFVGIYKGIKRMKTCGKEGDEETKE